MFPIFAGNSASTGYNLTRSLRFRASASAYLSRTMTTPTNNLKWTLSAWVKRGSVLTTENQIMNAGTAGSDDQFVFTSSSQLGFYVANGAAYYLITNAVYRDPAAWYHIVFVYDSANATAANRLLMYVNGTQVTSFATALYPTQNYASQINSAVLNRIGLRSNSASPFDGYLTEVNFIDGQALTPSSFGSTNALTGVWQPARYTGTYGTNGFYLPFTDNSALTTSSNVGLGKDFSGNGNYWTTNNISITAGVTYDSMTDVPTLTSATASNFCTWNPVAQSTVVNGTVTRSNGNLTSTDGGTTYGLASIGTIASTTGKFYWEVTMTSAGGTYGNIGVVDLNSPLGAGTHTGIIYSQSGNKGSGSGVFASSGSTGYGATYTTGDIIGVALDLTGGSITFYKNNTSQGVAYTGISGNYTPAVGDGQNTTSYTFDLNCGQRPFAYTPPTGFVALNTFNLPTSTIVKGNTVMDATLYTGNSSTQTVTNAGAFKPDLVWIKDRTVTSQHVWTDSVRGVDRQLFSSLTNAEQTSTTGITSLNSNGFTTGANPSPTGATNSSSDAYVAWQWQAGQGSSSSNTNGTITSTVSVNASAGFSVVTWTGTGANATVGHGLGVAPQLIINKPRNSADNWISWHTSLGALGYIYLNLTNASNSLAAMWNSTLPTSSVFSVGTNSNINSSAQTMVSYCWTSIAGYSAFGSYTGNGSTDGPFVYTGFRPRWVMFKRTDSTSSWTIWDTAMNTYNVVGNGLYADLSNAESTGNSAFDYLSNGFKVRNSFANINSSGGTYIYMAFAENPFKNALAR